MVAIVTGGSGIFFPICVALYSAVCNLNIKYDLIIFEYGMDDKQKKFLRDVFKAKIIHYDRLKNTAPSKWTHIAYAKYECFNMLSEYEQVMWLDYDTVCNENIDGIFSRKSGLVARKFGSLLKEEYKIVPDIINAVIEKNKMTMSFNAGVLVFNRDLPPRLTEQCYLLTLEQGENVTRADQGILNLIAIQESLKVIDLPVYYHNSPHDFDQAVPQAILHFMGTQKPWDKEVKGWPIYPDAVEIWRRWATKVRRLSPILNDPKWLYRVSE